MTKKIILSSDAPAPIGPYSQAVEVNGTLYVSGQIALSAFESGASIEEETDQVMKNLGYIFHVRLKNIKRFHQRCMGMELDN